MKIAFANDPGEKAIDYIAIYGANFPEPERLERADPGSTRTTPSRTLRELQAIRTAIVLELSVDDSEVRAQPEAFGAWIDEQTNRVVVELPSYEPQDGELHELEERYGPDNVEVRGGFTLDPASTCPAARWGCQSPLRGGIQIDSGIGHCTTAYSAWDRHTGERLILTAGHCAPQGAISYHWGVWIGDVSYSRNWGLVDAAKVRVTNSTWNTSRWIYHHDGAQAYQIHGVYTGNNIPAGSVLCKSGLTTGLSCTRVINGDWSGRDSTGVWRWNQMQIDGCARGGDSGAPVYANYGAYGLVILATNIHSSSCHAGDYLIANYVVHVQSDLGVNIRTN